MMIDLSILVVLYDKDPWSSLTLQRISKYYTLAGNVNLVIWNNGPKSQIDNLKEFRKNFVCNVDIIETTNNIALSKIYNRFIRENESKIYVLLDDDSLLTAAYVNSLKAIGESSVGFPLIRCNHGVVSPKSIDFDISVGAKVPKGTLITALGSGMVIGNEVVKKLIGKYHNVFDERFVLYGVDTTFCLRLNEASISEDIKFIEGFEHSLSRLTKESSSMSNFRLKERSYDRGMRIRYYSDFPRSLLQFFYMLYQDFLNILLNKPREIIFSHFVVAFIRGRHYRSKD
ncbi:glycosyltransferase family 2 protein [Vibrio breoganii]